MIAIFNMYPDGQPTRKMGNCAVVRIRTGVLWLYFGRNVIAEYDSEIGLTLYDGWDCGIEAIEVVSAFVNKYSEIEFKSVSYMLMLAEQNEITIMDTPF
jgi:hypothetical protein